MLKKIIYISISCVLISTACYGQKTNQQKTEPAVSVNRIVAIVNDEIITQSELNDTEAELKQQFNTQNQPVPPEAKLHDIVLQQLINYRLELQLANRYEIKVAPSEVDQTIAQIASSHNFTVDQLKNQLAVQHSSYEEFEKKITEQIRINKLQQQMAAGKIKIADADVDAFRKSTQAGKEYKLIDFFIPVSENATPKELDNALSTAHDVRQKIASGADINQISPHFEDLGWRTKEDLPQLFADQLKNLTTLSSSPPLRAPNGYHVLKIVDSRSVNQKYTMEQAREILIRQQYQEIVKTEVEKARKQAYIRIIPE